MFLKVVNWSDHSIFTDDGATTFYLEKDNWDDNYYKTRYHLHLSGNHTDDGNPIWIGEVKILRKGQRADDNFQLESGKMDFLDFRFCSLGQSLGYYERLARLDKDLRYQILSGLRDIAIFPEFKKPFEREEGLEASLYHFMEPDDDLFILAAAMISGDFSDVEQTDIDFNFQIEGMKSPVRFGFDLPDHRYGEPEETQSRINIITGKEDSGKDKLLMKLSRIAFASNEERDLIQKEGTLEPDTICFTRIICVSYSPTITFRVPAIYIHEKEQVAREIQQGVGRFIYCGNHNLEKELEVTLNSSNIDLDGRVWEVDAPGDENTFFKTNEELTAEFIAAMTAIEQDLDKQDLLDDLFEFMKVMPELQFVTNGELSRLREDELSDFFEHLAGESQILLHASLHLILNVSPRSLVLFNAPETYLRPTLVNLLFKYARHLLEKQDATMIVATESLDLLKETKSKNVTILRKKDGVIEVSTPEIEMFGETTENIAAYLDSVHQKSDSQRDSPHTETLENFLHDN